MIWLGIMALIFLVPAAWAGMSTAPWVPTWQKDVKRILKLIPKKKNLTFVELGCGSGTVMLGVARAFPGIKIIGYEIQPIFFLVCWLKIKMGHFENVEVRMGNFFRADLSKADVVFLYWTEKTTPKIRAVRGFGGVREQTIISYAFPVPGWRATKISREEGRLPIFVYHFAGKVR